MSFPGTGQIWMNGKLLEWKDATIHIASHVIHYGSGVFEGARCYATPMGSACFRLDDHLRRLQDSAKIYRMEYPLDLAGWRNAVLDTIRANQMKACVKAVFHNPGLRFIFSTRSKTPILLDSSGNELFGGDYQFTPGKDEVVREGSAGYIVTFGDSVYRALDAVERLKQEGIEVGLINKATLNVVDEEMMAKVGKAPFVMMVEAFNRRTGLGSRFGSWLLERGYTPKFAYLGTHEEGCGGLWEQFPHQGIDPVGIMAKVKGLVG